MKICAIISEYNPIHTGHMYHIQESKRLSRCDAVLALMSGNIVQRGDLAIADKGTRARCAILGGADIVVELPTMFALGTAEVFALGAIKMLNQIKDVSYLSFGSECGDIRALKKAADALSEESEEFKELLASKLAEGNSYPKSREIAFETIYPDLKGIISMPNNILAIEYLRALKATKSRIIPITVKRKGSNYNEVEMKEEMEHPSSTAIRRAIESGKIGKISFANEEIVSVLEPSISPLMRSYSGLSSAVSFSLSQASKEVLDGIQDATEPMVIRTLRASKLSSDYFGIINEIKNKAITMARIKRFLLCAVLGITKKDVEEFLENPNYFNTLAVTDEARSFLSTAGLNITARFSDFDNLQGAARRAAEIDTLAAQLYSSATGKHCPHLTHKLFIKRDKATRPTEITIPVDALSIPQDIVLEEEDELN